MKFHIATIFLVLSITKIYSQQEYLSNRTDFKDGIYFSYEDFANNEPSLGLDQVNFERKDGGIPTQRYLYDFRPSPDVQIDMDTVKVWGICLNGFPYINQSYFFESDPNYTKVKDYIIIEIHAYTFSRIMFIGHLCHFTAEGENRGGEPLNDLLPELNDFRLSGDNRIIQQYLLKSSTGEISKFKPNKLLELIKDDEELFTKYSEMSSRKRKKEIFNIFREYNSKHPIEIRGKVANH